MQQPGRKKTYPKTALLLSFLFLICSEVNAQPDRSSLPAVTLNGFLKGALDAGPISYLVDSNNTFEISDISQSGFGTTYADFIQRLNRPSVNNHYWLKFSLANLSDSSLAIYLYCGEINYLNLYYFSKDQMAQSVKAGNLHATQPDYSFLQKTTPAVLFLIKAHQKGELFLELIQKTEEYNFDGISLYDEASLYQTQGTDFKWIRNAFIFQLIFHGFILCQLLYVFFQWIIIRRREYLYYFLYILSIVLYFLSKLEHLYYIQVLFSRFPLMTVYLSKTLLIFPYFFYFRFVRNFLDMPVNFPAMNKWIIRIENFLLIYLVSDLAFILLTFNVRLQREIYSYVFILLFIITTSFIVSLLRRKNKLIYYILSGSLLVGIGNVIGLVLTYLNDENVLNNISGILIFSQIGIILEIICFSAGLSYKSMSAEKEKIKNQEKLIDQLRANELLQFKMQTIRNTIAQDLHDEIGSTLSSISILSNLALKEKNAGQTLSTMLEIKDSSVTLMEKMDDIVWSINPKNDSLDNLLLRIKHFATVLFEAKNIDYAISIQENISEVKLPMEFRQHIYLICKEAINNIVKYADATKTVIEVNFQNNILELLIGDNGRGFDSVGSFVGNGLDAMRNRASQMQATLTIHSAAGKGCQVLLRIKIK